MITNDQEYRVTQERIDGLSKGLAAIEAAGDALDPLALECQQSAHHRLIGDLRNQLSEYDQLRSGTVASIRSATLDELPKGLIKARIACGWSIEQLAEKLGWKPSLLARYEENEYETATMRKVIEVADALGVSVASVITLSEVKAAMGTNMRDASG